jgi:hypothetical protein
MDFPTILTSGATGSVLSVIIYIIFRLNHKRCRSKCGQQTLEVSLDIENTTPTLETNGFAIGNKTDSVRNQASEQETVKDEAQGHIAENSK